MTQYFYLVTQDREPVKIFLQESQAIKWGRTLATKEPFSKVELRKQEITTSGQIETSSKSLFSFK